MTNREELPILVDQALSAYSMLEGARLILVGLSGGADSVALTHYLRFGRGLPLLACHVNHNLRGRESLRDEEFVRALCDQWKIPLAVKSVWLDRYAAQKGLGLEEAGREVRYRFFGQVMKANGANRAATAHTASDNLETLLLNLARGTARKGLCGIPPVRPMLTEGIPPNSMIRPLILCSREDVEDYCLHNGLSYVIDSSNMQDDYARNKLRHRVIPVLRGLNPEAVRAVSRTTAIFREEEACLDRAARQLLENSRDGDGLSLDALLREDRAIRRRALGCFLEEWEIPLSAELLEDALAMTERGSGKRTLAPSLYLLVRRGRVWLDLPRDPHEAFRVSLESLPARAELPDGLVLEARLEELPQGKAWRDVLPHREASGEKVYKNLLYLALDYDKIKGIPSIRQRLPGDRIALAGRNGTKTVKKLLIEQKLTQYEKSILPVVADEEGVAALWGVGVDRRCAPGPETRRLLILRRAEASARAEGDGKSKNT